MNKKQPSTNPTARISKRKYGRWGFYITRRFIFTRPDKVNKLFNIVKIIIIANDTLAVIYYPLLFIPFKAVKESCFPVSFGK